MIILTEKAATEVKRVLEEQEMTSGEYSLKVGVAGGGCSGFQYSLGFDKTNELNEEKYFTDSQHGVSIAMDKSSVPYLDGTTIDFKTDLDQRGFAFDNPKACGGCGCGNSFSCG